MPLAITSAVQAGLAFFVGVVLLLSGAPKIAAPRSFVRVVVDYEVLPTALARLYGVALPWVECVVGLLLLTGFLLQVAAGLAVLTFVSFLIAVSINLRRGRDMDCHCFGDALSDRIGRSTVVRLVLVLIPSLLVLLSAPPGVGGPWIGGQASRLGGDLGILLPLAFVSLTLVLLYVLVTQVLAMAEQRASNA